MTDTLIAQRVAIHVHTALDDGDKPIGEVIAEARAAGADVLMLTDHHQARGAELGYEGYHDDLLVIVGTEFSTRENDHLLCFGLHDKVNTRRQHTPDALHLLKQLGALVFIAHPQGRPVILYTALRYPFTLWQHPGYDGVEVWSYMHDWIEGMRPWKLAAMCTHPARYVTGPAPEVTTRWDTAATRRRVAGLGALDTHGRMLPLGLGKIFSWAREGVLPYGQNFRAFSHYVLTPPRTGETRADIDQVLLALKEARGWIVHDELHAGRDCRFVLETDTGGKPLGSELHFKSGQALRVELPTAAHIRLQSRGIVLAEDVGTTLRYAPTDPGEYRVEADLPPVETDLEAWRGTLQKAIGTDAPRPAGRPWLRTNHIYLREPRFGLRDS